METGKAFCAALRQLNSGVRLLFIIENWRSSYMSKRRLLILTVFFVGYQFVGSIVSDYMFKQHTDQHIELTQQSMIADGVPANETRHLVSGLRDLMSGVSSYMMMSSTIQMVLSATMLMIIFSVCRKD
ncbi:MAG: hypothetical protein M3261_06530 [Thermoproteota archaeon]|nr:hypothetical protein [Thermoproteota archaeon]